MELEMRLRRCFFIEKHHVVGGQQEHAHASVQAAEKEASCASDGSVDFRQALKIAPPL